MDDPQLLRYSRHLLLDEIGIEGQARIAASRMLVVGAGGLGCPAAIYLAAAGVGRLTIVDGDVVDLTNLQRQIAHTTARIGLPKADSARSTLAALNPDIEIVAVARRVDAAALDDLVAAADIVLDCSDNFATRYAINRACVARRRALVCGAAIRFDGQITVVDPRRADSGCYACLFPEDPEAADEACATMGVFAPLTGIIGTLQAAEALKLAAAVGASLAGRLCLIDALHMQWREVRFERDPQCPVCGAFDVRTTTDGR